MTDPAIIVEGLVKRFGKVEALRGVDLQVPPSTVFGLLGPNGAGKTTAVRILTTLLHPDAGRATVAGLDVVRQAEELRHVIGLAGQNAAIDENLTGLENLEMVGRLYHVPAAEAKRRGEELLERFELSDAAHRTAKTYSGGMRRRLDLGASLVGKPQVLFLDEPTTGLDPRSRLEMWDIIRELVMEGTSILLTTQYLEEADRLADKISVIDVGRVIAEGTSDELKARVGGEVLALRVAERDRAAEAAGTVLGLGPGGGNVDNNSGEINVPVGSDGTAILTEAVRRLDAEGIKLADVALRRPTLDDVFLALTGHAAEEAEAEQAPEDGGRRRREKKREKV
ncbi:MAG TPA: ATP-binding cassette domain-containing protein [Actinomycetota bacterium]|nr:ATP-binding cassette domain-containing protein [Actinomycetota bacterium]